MNLAFETILIQNYKPTNIAYHEARLNKTRKDIFGADNILKLDLKSGMKNARCKVIYSNKIESIEFAEYIKQPVSNLKFVHIDFEYSHKWLDRKNIDALDDGSIMLKDGLITDTKIANIAFFDGMEWLTPKKPLLYGTARARLLDSGFLKTKDIAVSDIKPYYEVAIMNALRGFEKIGKVKDIITL